MPGASKPHATSTRGAAPSPTLRGMPRPRSTATPSLSARFAQDVSHSAKSVQQSLLPRVDLAAQIGDIGLDDVDVAAEVVAPHMVEDLRLGQHGAGIDDEVAQQGELRR